MLADEFAQTISERRSVGPKHRLMTCLCAPHAPHALRLPTTPSFRAVL